MTPDGLSMAFIDTLAPGGAAKLAVEEGKLRPGRVLVSNEFGARTVWDVHETRIVYSYEVRDE
jgi:hypothetical protein